MPTTAALADVAIIVLKAVAVVMLARIAIVDFRIQKIRNEQVLQLLAIALALLALQYMKNGDWRAPLVVVATSAVLFVVVIGFWFGGKIGAGDVKLLTIMPLLVGTTGALPFLIALLVFTLATYFIMKFPLVLPERWFRTYIQSLASTGRVPFGVPISAAAVVAVLVSVVAVPVSSIA